MYCNNCGEEIPNNAIHCPACGTRVREEENVQTVSSMPQVEETAEGLILNIKCPICGSIEPKESAYSSGWQVVTCCLGLLPALLYYFLRHNKIKCFECGNTF